METVLVIWALSIIFSLIAYVWMYWYEGNDVTVGDIISMIFCAAIPGLNVFLAIYLWLEVFDKPNSGSSIVLIKGRKESD